jgi:DNA helicase-2/ATP-dependent DNA helicase PcrA
LPVSFKELSSLQRKIVRHEAGPLLILAGPGTGKTEVLTHRIAYLHVYNNVPSDEILAVTFSRKAAKEMIDRLRGFPGLEKSTFHVSTLHANALRLLTKLGALRKFLVANDESRLLIRDAAEDVGLPTSGRILRLLEKRIELSKAKNLLPNEVSHSRFQEFYERYEQLLDLNDAIDLQGLVVKATRILLSGKSEFSSNFKGHLLVDEYQDINPAEHQFIQILARNARSLFVVGDDDQSIYGWRGADPGIIRDFKKNFKNGQIDVLEESHRCTGNILEAARAVVSKDPESIDKPLSSSRGDGAPVRIVRSKSWAVEALWIADRIRKWVVESVIKPSDIAILVRTPNLAEFLAEQLRIVKMNFAFWRSGDLLSDKDVLDIIAPIRLIVDQKDNLALRRCLTLPFCYGVGRVAEGIMRRTAEKHRCTLWEVAANARRFSKLDRWLTPLEAFVAKVKEMEDEFSELNVGQIVKSIAKQLGTDERVRVKGLLDLAESMTEDSTMEDFLREINKRRGVDLAEGGPEPETEEENAVTIMTMHSAKGLGFKTVFILGMDEKILPAPNQDEWEQRRLCYVAMTRARDELFLCHSKVRKGPAARGHSFYSPSRFLSDIPRENRTIINNEYY